MSEKKVRHLKQAEPPEKAQMIEMAENLLEGIRMGRVLAIGAVVLGPENKYYKSAVMPTEARIGMMGALGLLKTRLEVNYMNEQDDE